jgi:hypothetical protein
MGVNENVRPSNITLRHKFKVNEQLLARKDMIYMRDNPALYLDMNLNKRTALII